MPNKLQKPLSEDEKEIIKGWILISTDYRPGKLSEDEKEKFRTARFLEEQGKKTHFILGEPIFQ